MNDYLNPSIPLIHLIGQETLKILNYKKILHYHKTKIILLLSGKTIHIYGSNLNIEYFDEDELSIHGCIQSVSFHGS